MTLECVEIETASHPRHAVIWLHGLGADGHDFEPIVPQLVRPEWPPLRFVFPHAPVMPISL
ncbi:MAG TPA: carboxylesterase, partial [Rhodanobacteraceae bacterium]|nr:carboxylesterase [Rhodanobacteraceae bacterium]